MVPFDTKDIQPNITAEIERDGIRYRTVFGLMAEKYLDKKYSPESVAQTVGVSSRKIISIASELASIAFEEEIVITFVEIKISFF